MYLQLKKFTKIDDNYNDHDRVNWWWYLVVVI